MKTNLFLCSTLLAMVCTFVGCGPTMEEYNRLQRENDFLTQQVDSLKKEIEMYQNTPDKLFAEAQDYIKAKDLTMLYVVSAKLDKYHPTSTEAQKVHTSITTIEKEKAAAAKRAEEERLKAVKRLKSEFDDVQNITWYYNTYFTHYNNTNHVSVYMGKSERSVWLRLKMSYEGDNWIFFDKAYLSYDGHTKQILFNEYQDKKSDNGYGGQVWEWIDVSVDDDILYFLRQLVNGKSVKMQLSGKYGKTHTLSANEIKGIKDVLLAYDVLKESK